MEPEPPLHHDTSEKRKALTYRVRGIPLGFDVIAVRKGLGALLETQDLSVDSLAPSSIGREGQVATIRVANSAKLPDPRHEWRIQTGRTLAVDTDNKGERVLAIDTHFLGFTPLYSPATDTEHSLDCIAISGLGSHAFGSWKDRDSHYMWLRDALPHDLPGARVLTYGYDTRLAGSHSFQNLEDVASKFRVSLRIALGTRPHGRPLIFIAHSLGGLVLKQALIQMASGDTVDIRNFQSTYGILFFGVPNQGMDISSLLAMVGSQPNEPFLAMLSKDAGILQGLIDRFRTIFEFKDSEIISLYETHASRTARKDTTGKWSMTGDYAVLVDRFSAKSGRSWEESHLFLQPIARNHSDMVKYSEYDDDGGIVGNFLIRFAKAAPAVIRDRINSLDFSSTSFPSNAAPLGFRSQPLGKQAGTEQLQRPVEAKHRTEKLGRNTGKQPKEREVTNDRRREGGSKAVVEKQKRPESSSPGIREDEDDLEMFANAGFDIRSASKQMHVKELQALVGLVNDDWMQRLESVPKVWLRCSVLLPRTLFEKGILTLKEYFYGRLAQTFEEVFAFTHLAIAAASFSHYEQNFYHDALQWQRALSDKEDKILFLKAIDCWWRLTELQSTSLLNSITAQQSLNGSDQTDLLDVLRNSKIINVCIGFLDVFEEAAICERNAQFPAAELALFALSRSNELDRMIKHITHPLLQQRDADTFRKVLIDTELQIVCGLLRSTREVEVALNTSGRRSSESPENFERYHNIVTIQCNKAMPSLDSDRYSTWRNPHYIVDLDRILEILREQDTGGSIESALTNHPNESILESGYSSSGREKWSAGGEALAERIRVSPPMKSAHMLSATVSPPL